MRNRLIKIWIACLCQLVFAGCVWEETESRPDYLPLDDSEYPYAGLPRVVIETDDFHEIRDRESEHGARFQVYGDSAPETEVLDLTLHGRGNSSFKMPKYGFKMEFKDKVSLFGMPKSRDWVVVANYGDKTYLRNYMMSRLSEWLGARYTPRFKFVELYLNRKYMGLYLFSESIKVAKNRVRISETDSSFLFEKEEDKKLDSPFVTTDFDCSFHIRYPKNLTDQSKNMLLDHLNDFEWYLAMRKFNGEKKMKDWLDIDDFLLYYWVQEYSKNEDGNFARSIFLTWERGGVIHFGPLWDFDLAFGNASRPTCMDPENLYIRDNQWFHWIFRDSTVKWAADRYWREHKETFHALIDSVPLYAEGIRAAVRNEYKRWPILPNTENWALKDPYDSYDEALKVMMEWMEERYRWLDRHI